MGRGQGEHHCQGRGQGPHQQQQSFMAAHPAIGHRPGFGALHQGIDAPIPEVVSDAAGPAHGEAPQHDQQHQVWGGPSSWYQPEAPPRRNQQDEASTGFVPAQQLEPGHETGVDAGNSHARSRPALAGTLGLLWDSPADGKVAPPSPRLPDGSGPALPTAWPGPGSSPCRCNRYRHQLHSPFGGGGGS